MSNKLRKYNRPVSPIAGIVTCKLCGETFTGPAVLMIRPDQPAAENERVKKFMEELARHTINKHDGHDSAMQLKAHEYLAMLRLMNFVLSDKELSEQRDFFRWSVHQATLNATISDASIKGLSKQIAQEIYDTPNSGEPYKQFIAEKIAAALTELRAELQEPGKFEVSPVLDSKGAEIATAKQ